MLKKIINQSTITALIGNDYSTAEKHSSYPTHLTKLQRREYTSTRYLRSPLTQMIVPHLVTALRGLFSGLSFTTGKIILQW